MKPSLRRCLIAGALPLGVVALYQTALRPARAADPLQTIKTEAAVPAGYVPLEKGSVNFNAHIAPIIYSNCTTCHREGEVAPFALSSYADVKKRAKQIAGVTQSGYMPPWKADEGREKFLDAHQLSAQQIGLIRQWSDEGAPEGKGPAVAPPKFAAGWQNGTPDVVLGADQPYQLAAEGDDVYRCFVIPTHYDEDRYISAMEVRPGNRPVVHHVIAYLDTSGEARQKDALDDGPGYTSFGGIGVTPSGTLGGWAPGLVPHLTPPGTGILLPKGADIVLQVHYHKTGKPETDLTKIGLFFAKGPVDKRIRNLMVVSPRLRIPAGDANYVTGAATTIPTDITALNVMPHMHLLGKGMKVTANLPDGTAEKLVNVTDYDFNWQMSYTFKDAVKLPAGTRLDMTARYDNSTGNLANPSNPPKQVTWGEQTTDEMCIAFLFYTVDSEHLLKGEPVGSIARGLGERGAGGGAAGAAMGAGGAAGAGGQGAALMQMALKRFDANGNGVLDDDEKLAALKWWRERQGAQ